MAWDIELTIKAPPEKVYEIELNWRIFPRLRELAGAREFHLLRSSEQTDYFWLRVKDLPLKSSFIYGKRLKRRPQMIVTMFVYRLFKTPKLQEIGHLERTFSEQWESCFYRTMRLRPLGERRSLLQLNEPGRAWTSASDLAQIRLFYHELRRIAEGELLPLGVNAVAEEVGADDAEAWYSAPEAEREAEARTIDAEFEDEPTTVIDDVFDPYRVLNLSRDASLDDVKRSYRSLALTWHPDRLANRGAAMQQYAHNQFVQITAAYHTILRMSEL